MFGKLGKFWDLLQYGKQVGDIAFWKQAQAVGQPVIAGLLITIVGLLKGTKYEVPLDDATASMLGGTVFFIVNAILTLITSKHVGIGAKPVEQASVDAVSTEQPIVAEQAVPVVQPESPAPQVEQVYKGVVQHFDISKIEEAKRYLERDMGRQ